MKLRATTGNHLTDWLRSPAKAATVVGGVVLRAPLRGSARSRRRWTLRHQSESGARLWILSQIMEAAPPPSNPTAYPSGRAHQSRKKLALLYLAFVAVPLLGVILVIHLGRGLAAPHPIKGRWSLETKGPIAAALECRAHASDKEDCTLDIAQSGDQLRLSLAGGRNIEPLAFKGKLNGTGLEARAKSEADSGPRKEHEPVQLRADLEEASPEKLVGHLEVGGCPQPVRLPFNAIREGKAP